MSNSALKIVVCDDDPVTRTVMSRSLYELGYPVSAEAEDAVSVVNICQDMRPHIVFLDINMPGLDGLAAVELLKTRSPESRVVLVSGASTAENVRRAVKLGVKAFVVKPFTKDKIAEAILKCTG